METNNGIPAKAPFYKNKAFVIPLVALFALAFISAATYAYFHSVQVDLTVTEARSSADLPVTLSIKSGESTEMYPTIYNSANVQLCAILTWEQVGETNVTYENNLPQTLTLPANANTQTTVTFTADEVTEAGLVTGNILYTKIACAA